MERPPFETSNSNASLQSGTGKRMQASQHTRRWSRSRSVKSVGSKRSRRSDDEDDDDGNNYIVQLHELPELRQEAMLFLEEMLHDKEKHFAPWRQRLFRAIYSTRRMDTIILTVIFINCIFLALDDPIANDSSDNTVVQVTNVYAEPIFTAVFAIEMTVKIIAQGVILPKIAYLRDPWNVLDFVIVLCGFITFMITAVQGDKKAVPAFIGIIRAVRLLKPLKAMNKAKEVELVVSSLLSALPQLFDVVVLYMFFVLIMGIVGVQLWKGTLSHSCHFSSRIFVESLFREGHISAEVFLDAAGNFSVQSDVAAQYFEVIHFQHMDDGVEVCRSPPTIAGDPLEIGGFGCPYFYECRNGANPFMGMVSFDDIFKSFLTTFTVITLEGWADIMYVTFRSTSKLSAFFFFISVSFGSFFVINLSLVIINNAFVSNVERIRENDLSRMIKDVATETIEETEGGQESLSATLSQRFINGSVEKTRWLVTHRLWTAFIIFIVVVNCILLASEFHGQPHEMSEFVKIASYVFTVIYIMELLLKLISIPFREYIADWNNWIEVAIVISSILHLILEDGGRGGLFNALRMFRLLHLARHFPELWAFVNAVGGSVKSVAVLTLLLLLVMFIYALFGIQYFGGNYCSRLPISYGGNTDEYAVRNTPGDIRCREDPNTPYLPRESFDTLWIALITVFEVISGEGWNTLMYHAMNTNSEFSQFYFVSLFVIGHYIILNLFIAVLLGGMEAARAKLEEESIAKANAEEALATQEIPRHLQFQAGDKERQISFISAPPEDPDDNTLASRRVCGEIMVDTRWEGKSEFSATSPHSLGGVCPLPYGESYPQAPPPSIPGSPHYSQHNTPDCTPPQSPTAAGPRTLQDRSGSFSGDIIIGKPRLKSRSKEEQFTQEQQDNVLQRRRSIALKMSKGGKTVQMTAATIKNAAGDNKKSMILASASATKSTRKLLKRFTNQVPRGEMGSPRASNNLNFEEELKKVRERVENLSDNLAPPKPSFEEDLHDYSEDNDNDNDSKVNSSSATSSEEVVLAQEEVRPFGVFCRKPSEGSVTSEVAGALDLDLIQEGEQQSRMMETSATKLFGDIPDSDDDSLNPSNPSTNKNPSKKGVTIAPDRNILIDISCDRAEPPPPEETRLQRIKRTLDENTTALFILKEDHCLRVFLKSIVESWVFEVVVVGLILASTVCLAVENPIAAPNETLPEVLETIGLVLTSAFVLEILLRVLVYGFALHSDSYLRRDAWNLMEFAIVASSVVDLIITLSTRNEKKTNLGVMRIFRMLRPLRFINKSPGLKAVVDSLAGSVRGLSHVIVLTLTIFLTFAIVGMQLFMGKFHSCTFRVWGDVSRGHSCEHIDTENFTLGCPEPFVSTKAECTALGYKWVPFPANFDNIWNALLTVFQISTLDEWVLVMHVGMDVSQEIDTAPSYYNSPYLAFYFIIITVIGSFFLVNLFVGVLVSEYERASYGDQYHGILSDPQQEWRSVQVLIAENCKPVYIERGTLPPWQEKLHKIVTSREFDLIVTLCIVLNVVLMSYENAEQSENTKEVLKYISQAFVFVYTIECVMKLLALQPNAYFQDKWNRFDFIVVVISWIGLALTFIFGFSGAMGLTLLRIFRLAKLLRVARVTKGVRLLLKTLFLSLPALVNVAALLALCFSIFAILGVHLFGKIARGAYVTNYANFDNFINAVLLLFRLMTGEGWAGFMYEAAQTEAPFCSDQLDECGFRFISPIFFVTFIVIAMFVMLNLIVAILLKEFSNVCDEDSGVITTDNLQDFSYQWERLDRGRTGLISVLALEGFLDAISAPLGEDRSIGGVYTGFLKAMRIAPYLQIFGDDKIYYRDVLLWTARLCVSDEYGIDVANLILPYHVQTNVDSSLTAIFPPPRRASYVCQLSDFFFLK